MDITFVQGCGIKGFLPTSVIQGNPPLYEHNSFWEALPLYHRSGHSPQPCFCELSLSRPSHVRKLLARDIQLAVREVLKMLVWLGCLCHGFA